MNKKNKKNISNFFEKVDNKDFLSTYIEDKHWIQYLKQKQNHREIKVLMKQNGVNHYFKPHAKEVIVEDRKLQIIIFDDITKVFEKIKALEDVASKDSLTQLFNRGKFNDVLSREIAPCTNHSIISLYNIFRYRLF